jgi:hypothetical protein
VLDAVPVRRPAVVARIATTAGLRVDAVAGALAALAVHGLVELTADGWRMTAAGRAERRTTGGEPDAELPLGWW